MIIKNSLRVINYTINGFSVILLDESDKRREMKVKGSDGFPEGIDVYDYPNLTDFYFTSRDVINKTDYIIFFEKKFEVLKDRGFGENVLDEIYNFVMNEIRLKKLKWILYD